MQKKLWIMTIGINLFILISLGSILGFRFNYLRELRATATGIAIENTEYAKTHPTSTPYPTNTPLPTSTPPPCYSTTISTAIIYLQPSRGRSFGSVSVPNKSIPLYFRQSSEDWWRTSIKDDKGNIVTGWISTNDLIDPNSCQTLETRKLSEILAISPENVLLEETFSSIEHTWLSGDGNPSGLSAYEYPKLVIRSADSVPTSALLQDVNLPNSFRFVTSFDRNSIMFHNYVAINFSSISNPSEYVEMRISSDCSFTWVTETTTYNTIALGKSANCGNDLIEDFIQVNLSTNDGNLIIDGKYNDVDFPSLSIKKELGNIRIAFIVVGDDMQIHYVLITSN